MEKSQENCVPYWQQHLYTCGSIFLQNKVWVFDLFIGYHVDCCPAGRASPLASTCQQDVGWQVLRGSQGFRFLRFMYHVNREKKNCHSLDLFMVPCLMVC
ncbi:hypothetical protein GE061_018401 [Apolygus lucorum]|uniref:Uncharacterized protein n=1 Tax=Apolygus lucorum TaxID=248454 RepID=A0A8S9XDR3_APOLU|nr:hypothetical protein GE061_018401 [Apolygus lucorum]